MKLNLIHLILGILSLTSVSFADSTWFMEPSRNVQIFELSDDLEVGELATFIRLMFPKTLVTIVEESKLKVVGSVLDLVELSGLLDEMTPHLLHQSVRATICRTDMKVYPDRNEGTKDEFYWNGRGRCFAGFYTSPLDFPFETAVEAKRQELRTLGNGDSSIIRFRHPWPGVRQLTIELERIDSQIRIGVEELSSDFGSTTRQYLLSEVDEGLPAMFIFPSNQTYSNEGLRPVLILETSVF